MERRNHVTVALSDGELRMLNAIIDRSDGYLNKSAFFRMAIEAEFFKLLEIKDDRIFNALVEKHLGKALEEHK